MWLYQLLDIAGTMANGVVICLMIKALCKNARIKYALPLLYVSYFAEIYILTWFLDWGWMKLPLGILLTVFICKLYYKDSVYKIATGVLLHHVIVGIAESASILTTNSLFKHASVMAGGKQFLIWQCYILIILLQICISWVCYSKLKNFKAEIRVKDFGIIFILFLLQFFYHQKTTTNILNDELNWFQLGEQMMTVLFSILFFALFLYLKNYFYLRDKAKDDQLMIERLQVQHSYYQEKLESEKRVRSLYHDIKNHLLILEGQNNSETKQMVTELRQQIADYEEYIHTGNEFLDIIIKEKAGKAKEQQTDFSAVLHFEKGSFIKPLDISTIFGNALDNALEASRKLPTEQRMITVKADCVREMLSIVFENNYLLEEKIQQKTTKQDKFLHGFGVVNIRKAVEKYGGQCSIHQKDGIFRMKIILPLAT